MPFRKNEKGYALVLVLLLIVFIMTVSAVFFRGSISNARQERIVDTNNLSIVAAEMGVDFYKTAITNDFNSKKEEHITNANIKLKSLYTNANKLPLNTIKNKEIEITDELYSKLKTLLKGSVDSLEIKKTIETNKLSFGRENFTVEIYQKEGQLERKYLQVTGDVIGERIGAKKGVLDFSLVFPLPVIKRGGEENNNNGSDIDLIPPPPPTTGTIETNWPCNKNNKNNCNETIKSYMKVGDVSIKKGSLKFLNHLVVNSIDFEGGNGASLVIEKDFYIKDSLTSKTHACIAVQGNFTAINSISSTNKLYLFIYGDANLPASIHFNTPNNKIYVSGNVFIDGVKQQPKKFSDVPVSSSSNSCSLPGPGEKEDNKEDEQNNSTMFETGWLDPEISVEYN